MAYVEGRVLWDPTLPGMTNAERAAVYAEMNRVIAALHSVDYRELVLPTSADQAIICSGRFHVGASSTARVRPIRHESPQPRARFCSQVDRRRVQFTYAADSLRVSYAGSTSSAKHLSYASPSYQPLLDSPIDETAPAIGPIGARENDTPAGLLQFA